jgi:hypothetical protein
MADEIKPGWFLITNDRLGPKCWHRRLDGRWANSPFSAFPSNNLPEGWTLGPRIEDLLGAAERAKSMLLRCRDALIGAGLNNDHPFIQEINAEIAREKI